MPFVKALCEIGMETLSDFQIWNVVPSNCYFLKSSILNRSCYRFLMQPENAAIDSQGFGEHMSEI